MFGLFARNNTRVKRAMLRSIYEDNLSILGRKRRHDRYKKMNVAVKISVMLFSMVVFLIIGKFDSSDLANVRDLAGNSLTLNKQTINNAQNHVLPYDNNFYLSNYESLFANATEPVWDIFGFKVKTIIIDPGHGGEDPGAVGNMLTEEKDITLDVARRLRDKLSKFKNYQILMTRENDVTVPLNSRIDFANNHNADLYISIHVNYIPRKPLNIIETYYFGTYADEETIRLAEKENKGTDYTLSAYRNVVQKIGNTMKFQESKKLATSIQKSLYGNISKRNKDIVDHGIKTAPFVVLLGVDVPSVLTEISTLSNEEEESKLNMESYREEIASYLEEGIVRYLNNNFNKGDIKYAARRIEG